MSKHRTAGGKPIDMEALAAQNKNTVALGNMRVNAAGDKLGKGGKVVQTASERVQDYYKENQNTTRETVSVKGTDEVEVEVELEEENKATKKTSKSKSSKTAKTAKTDTKASDESEENTRTQKTVEKTLPDGSIEIVDPEDDEGNNL